MLQTKNKIQINPLFTDHMILQRGKPVRVFGRGGKTGELVRVIFDGKTFEGIVGENEWEVWLDAMEACAEGKTLTVHHGDDELCFDDVVVGEIWLCGGQSNMAVSIQYILNKDPSVESDYCEYDNWRSVRYYERPYRPDSEVYVDSLPSSQWCVGVSFDQSRNFSATAMAFALNLAKMTGNHVPIGVVNCSVSGSPIESWLSAEAMADLPSYFPEWNCVHYNGMLFNIAGYSYGGFLWYQGCANAQPHMASAYRNQFEALMRELRSATKDVALPAVVVQLVQFEDWCSWLPIRQVQWDLMELPRVYTVCGIDLGCTVTPHQTAVEHDGIHPTDKWMVGKRAAGVAADKVLMLPPPSDGTPFGISPSIVSAVWQDQKIRLSVAGAKSLTPAQGEIGGFEVFVGSRWIPASACLDGTNVVLSVDSGEEEPQKFRYLQTNVVPEGVSYLYNEYCLPLAPVMDIPIIAGV